MTTYTSPQDGATLLHAHISQVNPTVNYYNDNIQMGDTASGTQKRRTIFNFTCLTGGTNIPLGALVTSAKLYLKISADLSSNARTFRMFRLKRSPALQTYCTWINYANGAAWSTAGGFGTDDCEQTDIGSLDFTASESVGTWKTFDLTPSAISEIISGAWTTPYILAKADTENTDAYFFYANDDAEANRPYIVVEYVLGGQVIIWSSE